MCAAGRRVRGKHKLHDPFFSGEGRIAYKGQLFSAPMDWRNIVEQLQARDLFASGKEKQVLAELDTLAQAEAHIPLPVMGAVLAQRVRVVVTAGLVEVNKLLKQHKQISSMMKKAGDGDLMIGCLLLLGAYTIMNLNFSAQHFLLLAVKVYY